MLFTMIFYHLKRCNYFDIFIIIAPYGSHFSNDKGIFALNNDCTYAWSGDMVIDHMKDTIKILSDLTKKDKERCLVFA